MRLLPRGFPDIRPLTSAAPGLAVPGEKQRAGRPTATRVREATRSSVSDERLLITVLPGSVLETTRSPPNGAIKVKVSLHRPACPWSTSLELIKPHSRQEQICLVKVVGRLEPSIESSLGAGGEVWRKGGHSSVCRPCGQAAWAHRPPEADQHPSRPVCLRGKCHTPHVWTRPQPDPDPGSHWRR